MYFFTRLLGEKETLVFMVMLIGSKICEMIALMGPMESPKEQVVIFRLHFT